MSAAPAVAVLSGAAPATSRRGLVLGAGGVLGYNWLVAALVTWAEYTGLDPGQFDVVVGTSAGSIAAAAIGSGVHPAALLRHLRGEQAPDDPILMWDYDRVSGSVLPPLPALRLGSPALAARVLREPRAYPPVACLSAFALRGRGSLEPLRCAIRRLSAGSSWPQRPCTWIVATDYDRGRREVFGRAPATAQGTAFGTVDACTAGPGVSGEAAPYGHSAGVPAPAVELAQAVAASCAVPGWYEPVLVGGRCYVDGGVCSSTSADLLVDHGLDEVIVLMPLGVENVDDSWHPLVRTERWVRRLTTRRTQREIARLRAAGTRVILLIPDVEVLAAMSWNVMDYRRRQSVLETSLRTTAKAWQRTIGAM